MTIATATTRAEARRWPPLDRQRPGSRPSTPQSVANWTGLGRERVPLPRSSSEGVGGAGGRKRVEGRKREGGQRQRGVFTASEDRFGSRRSLAGAPPSEKLHYLVTHKQS